MTDSVEDFELELRSLPGVINVGLSRRDGDVDTVTLTVTRHRAPTLVSDAEQIAGLYFTGVTIEVVDAEQLVRRDVLPPRVRIARVGYGDDGVCEVQLVLEGRTGYGRSTNGPLIGGAEAALLALRDLGLAIPFTLVSVTSVRVGREWPVVVALAPTGGPTARFGIARDDDDLTASVLATLNALNRYLDGSEKGAGA